ncbi:DUF6036 family nucleotidyltransferase [Hydrogenophaga sp.]|uniref:DUF6036 family nucleotidyltransferase n=1 Tax=Hydrogenophaga sp. TaxID=1904254 RepID=UPI002FC9044C
MNLDALFALLAKARELSGHSDYVVIGSLSILGLEDHFDVPEDMTLSNDVDCYTRDDPDRTFDLVAALGENSPWHQGHGYFLDAVTPALPTLPEGWRAHLIPVSRDSLTAWFLDPNDAAISKYARGEPRDRRWIRAGIRSGVVSLPMVRSRLRGVTFLDNEESQRTRRLIEEDQAWCDRSVS